MTLATPTRRMPRPVAVGDFLQDLLGKATTVDKRDELDLDNGDYVSGVFVEDDGTVGGACITDISLASFAGAALAMIPPAVAMESINRGELDEGLRENFHEVANISTALLNGPSVPHLKIKELVPGITDEVRDLVIKAAGRSTFNVTIADYGGGALALYAR